MPNLTKRDLVIRISDETGIVQRHVLHVIDCTLDLLVEGLSSGKTVEFRNFGIFQVKLRKARVGRNPHRPENQMVIPSRTEVRFKAGKSLKSKVLKLSDKPLISRVRQPGAEEDRDSPSSRAL